MEAASRATHSATKNPATKIVEVDTNHSKAAPAASPANIRLDGYCMNPRPSKFRNACACNSTPGVSEASGSRATSGTGATWRSVKGSIIPTNTGLFRNERSSAAVSFRRTISGPLAGERNRIAGHARSRSNLPVFRG